MRVAGVDGCKAGWLVIRAEASNRLVLLDLAIEPTFADFVARTGDCTAVAVDIPIGLSEREPRLADGEARRVLQPLRHNSVFPAPRRPVLRAGSYQEACDISFRISGKKLSKQSYAIMPKIRDADASMTPDLQERVVEVHPEVCFWKLNGEQPVAHPKKSLDGADERLRLLSDAFEDDLASVVVPRGAGRDDLYDACAAAWTASRVAYGSETRLPVDPPVDARGLRMEIVY